jgi:hypothetical protein
MHNATPADPLSLQWQPWLTDADRYDAHGGGDRLSVAPTGRGTWSWQVERLLPTHAESVAAMAGGEALTRIEAQLAAERYRFEEYRLIYDHPTGPESLWIGATDRVGDRTHTTWTACLYGDAAQVHLSISRQTSDQPWYWSRQCAKAAAILALSDGRMHGYCESRELAMIACIEAPDQLHRAAAIYLAERHAERGIL